MRPLQVAPLAHMIVAQELQRGEWSHVRPERRPEVDGWVGGV